jgi:hypothetical protein
MRFKIPRLIVRFNLENLADCNKVVEAGQQLRSAGLLLVQRTTGTLDRAWTIEPPEDQRTSPLREIKFTPDGAGALKMSVTVTFVFRPELREHVDMALRLLNEVGVHFGTNRHDDKARVWTWDDKLEGPAQLEIDPKSFTVEEGPGSGLGGFITKQLARGD